MAKSKMQSPTGKVNSQWVFLGLDLISVLDFFRTGLRESLSWSALSWFNPMPAVRVRVGDAKDQIFQAPHWVESPRSTPQFDAWCIPQHRCLVKTLHLPPMSPSDLQHLLQYEVATLTPFDIDNTLWSHWVDADGSDVTSQKVVLVIAARSSTEHDYQVAKERMANRPLELWALTPDDMPIVFKGYDEYHRLRYQRKKFLFRVSWFASPFLLLLALLTIPVWQARAQLASAEHAYQQLQSRVGGYEHKRLELNQKEKMLTEMGAYIDVLPEVLPTLELLTEKIPPTASLSRFDMDGRRVMVSGQADNAAALMQTLSAVPQITDLRSPSAITKMPGMTQELFALEFKPRWRTTASPETEHKP